MEDELFSEERCVRDIREAMEIQVCPERSFITVLAVHNDPEKNFIAKIMCKKGIAIAGYIHDTITDSYHIECHDYKQIGYIPISYCLTMPGVGNWRQRIPIPEVAIRRYFTTQQKADLRAFKATYKSSNFTYQFMQIIDCH